MPFTIGRWRRYAARVIHDTLRDLFAWNPQATEKEAREVLRTVYPFGERKYFPYRMWCKEQRLQLHKHFGVPEWLRKKRDERDPEQRKLF